MTRAEHLAWAQARAVEFLPDDPVMAMTSFVSDLRKHAELEEHPVIELMGMHAVAGLLSVRDCRELIEGTR